jgi:hypothetical protein
MTATKQDTTAQEIINRRIYLNYNWQDFELSEEAQAEAIEMIVETLGGQNKTKDAIRRTLSYSRPQHWGLRRVIFSKYGDKLRCSYCAGQDYPAELNQIRNAIK